jgi:hypothetical protein
MTIDERERTSAEIVVCFILIFPRFEFQEHIQSFTAICRSHVVIWEKNRVRSSTRILKFKTKTYLLSLILSIICDAEF